MELELQNAYGQSGNRFIAMIVYVIKHKVTGEYLAVFSSHNTAENHIHNVLAFQRDELFIQRTIVDYYAK